MMCSAQIRDSQLRIVYRALHGVRHAALAKTGPDFDLALRARRHARSNTAAPAKAGNLRHADAGRAAAQHLQHIAPANLLLL